MQEEDANSLFGVLDVPHPTLSFSNPVYELTNPIGNSSDLNASTTLIQSESTSSSLYHDRTSNPSGSAPTVVFKVEHVLSSNRAKLSSFRRIREGFNERVKVARLIFPYMISIALAYLVTLSLYPGIESEIISCKLKSWM